MNSGAFGSLGKDRTLLTEESFHSVISLERKRTERSRRPFLLMLLDMESVPVADRNGKRLAKILAVLFASIRETDGAGFYKDKVVIGIVFTELASDPVKSCVNAIVTRIKGSLYCGLTFEDFSSITVSYHVFPEEWDHDVPQRPSHPTLYPDVQRRETGSRSFPWSSG